VDAADHHMVDDAAQRVEDELGEIDVWVNNAFSTRVRPVHVGQTEEYHV
jgi:NADP-dependent 3-hydroxy acid dehydrogenase YdfG